MVRKKYSRHFITLRSGVQISLSLLSKAQFNDWAFFVHLIHFISSTQPRSNTYFVLLSPLSCSVNYARISALSGLYLTCIFSVHFLLLVSSLFGFKFQVKTLLQFKLYQGWITLWAQNALYVIGYIRDIGGFAPLNYHFSRSTKDKITITLWNCSCKYRRKPRRTDAI